MNTKDNEKYFCAKAVLRFFSHLAEKIEGRFV